MTESQPAPPVIRRPGTRPTTPHKLFVNIPVGDLQRSIDFFEALGFSFNVQFTDATATCMLVGEDAYFMLLTHERFKGFSRRPIPDFQTTTAGMFAISVESRTAVDQMVLTALNSGGSEAIDPQDHGFMYSRSFHDPDGHTWEVFWMDPAGLDG